MVQWIVNLPLRFKFVLLSGVALLMVAAPSSLVLTQSIDIYQGLRQEQSGLQPAIGLLKLVRLTQEHRGMSAAVLNGDAGKQAQRAERQQAIDALFGSLCRVQRTARRRVLRRCDLRQPGDPHCRHRRADTKRSTQRSHHHPPHVPGGRRA